MERSYQWEQASGDVTPSEPISTIIFSGTDGSLRTDTARRIRPLALAHNYNTAMLETPHDTVRKSVKGVDGTTTVTLASSDFSSGVAQIALILVKLTTQQQFSVPSGGVQVNIAATTKNDISVVAGPFDVLRGPILTNFGVIPVVILESGKYAIPVNAYVDPTSTLVLTMIGTTVNDTIEVMIPGPGAVEALAILDAAGLTGLAMSPTS
jgi:hypothetical protein